ncbi:hypothetical protein Tco_0593450 [Tanacetum coccineum]
MENGKAWIETCSWEEFKELFIKEFAPTKLNRKIEENMELKREYEYKNSNVKKPKYDIGKNSTRKPLMNPCTKCHKFHYGECRLKMKGCFQCSNLDHASKDCIEPTIICYGYVEVGHKVSKCPNVIQAKPLRSVRIEEEGEKK